VKDKIAITTFITAAACRIYFFFAVQGKHDQFYYLVNNCLKDCSQYLCFGVLSYLMSENVVQNYLKLILQTVSVFFIATGIVLLYVLLPEQISTYINMLAIPYFLFWGMLMLALSIYYIFNLRLSK
jgi:hypothetical protein